MRELFETYHYIDGVWPQNMREGNVAQQGEAAEDVYGMAEPPIQSMSHECVPECCWVQS